MVYNYFVLSLILCQIWLNFVQSYVSCILCGISLYGLCVRESVKTQDILKIKEVFAARSWEAFPQSEVMCSAHDWNAKSYNRWLQLVFASISRVSLPARFLQDTRETFYFAILSYLIYHVSTHTIYTHITHILRGVLSERKP